MKVIKINGKKMRISTSVEQGLKIIASNGYITKASDLWHGKGRHIRQYLPDHSIFPEIGIVAEVSDSVFTSEKGKKFFIDNPRCKMVFIGNKRRINAILKKCDAQ